MRKAAAQSVQIEFEGLPAPVGFCGGDEVLGVLGAVLAGWPSTPARQPAAAPRISVEVAHGGYRLTAPWRPEPIIEPTAASAACSLIVDLVRGYAVHNKDRFCLHAAGACFGEKLVVFPSEYRAGKSMLVTALASTGVHVFAEDVMSLADDDSGAGQAFGICPRLRLPLPESVGEALEGFVARHKGPSDDWYQYLRLPPERLARYGEKAAIVAFVFLDRRPDGPPELQTIGAGESLRRLLIRNFGSVAPAVSVLDRMRLLVGAIPCLRLRYSRLHEAAELMMTSFPPAGEPNLQITSQEGVITRTAVRVKQNRVPKECSERSPIFPDSMLFVQRSDVELRRVDGDTFLAVSSSNGIFGLDVVGGLIWELLGEPASVREIVEALEAIFADEQPERLRTDTERLLGELQEQKLVESVDLQPTGRGGPAELADRAITIRSRIADHL
jgi:hypothetical protein